VSGGLAAALRAAGLTVTEHRVPGRPGTFTPSGVMLHHTAGAATGDAPSLGFVIRGTASVPGPMYQVLIARSGHVHLISEGRANHAGTGSGLAAEGIPADQGNGRTWGIGVESPGRSMDWPPAQWDATHTVARVLLARMGRGVERVWRHRDYTPRKIDTVYPLADHRAAVLGSAPVPGPTPTPTPEDDMAFTATGPDGQNWHLAGVWRVRITWDQANALASLAPAARVPHLGAIPAAALSAFTEPGDG